MMSMVLSWTATINGSNQMVISHQKLRACKRRRLKWEQAIDIARHARRSWPMATSEDHWHTSRQCFQWWPLLLFVCAWLCSSKAHLKFCTCSSRSRGNGWSTGQAKVAMCRLDFLFYCPLIPILIAKDKCNTPGNLWA